MLKAGNGSGAGRDGERADRPVASPEPSVVAKRGHKVAYSWRDEFLSGQANIANVGPPLPQNIYINDRQIRVYATYRF